MDSDPVVNNNNNNNNKTEKSDKLALGYIRDADYYFDSYSHFSIHQEMLKDTIRTKAYMHAITKNPQLFKDKIVLDVGSGTGILSIFAAKSGAKHVYGIQKANIYLHSRNIIEENKLTDKITIINGLVEQVQLPVQKVDIIISEWMGYFLLYQSMLDCVLYARDKWLKPDGILLPDKCTMHIAALDDQHYYKQKLNFWNNVYGVSMKCIKKWVLSQPIIDPIQKHNILSNDANFKTIDLKTVKTSELEFKTDFYLKGQDDGNIYGFVTWFDCFFSHGQKVIMLSTSPYKKQTHWKQCVFYLDKPFAINAETQIKGNLEVSKAQSNVRELNVQLQYSVNGEKKPIQYYRIS